MGKVAAAVQKYKAGTMTLDQLVDFVRDFKFQPSSAAAGRSMLDPTAYRDVENDAFLGIVTDSVPELAHLYDTGVLTGDERKVLSKAVREGHSRK